MPNDSKRSIDALNMISGKTYSYVNCCLYQPELIEIYSAGNDRNILIWSPKYGTKCQNKRGPSGITRILRDVSGANSVKRTKLSVLTNQINASASPECRPIQGNGITETVKDGLVPDSVTPCPALLAIAGVARTKANECDCWAPHGRECFATHIVPSYLYSSLVPRE